MRGDHRLRLAALSTLAAFSLAACASRPDADAVQHEAAYRQCLEDNMAAAMAWEAIERMCRERTSAENHPLDYYPPRID